MKIKKNYRGIFVFILSFFALYGCNCPKDVTTQIPEDEKVIFTSRDTIYFISDSLGVDSFIITIDNKPQCEEINGSLFCKNTRECSEIYDVYYCDFQHYNCCYDTQLGCCNECIQFVRTDGIRNSIIYWQEEAQYIGDDTPIVPCTFNNGNIVTDCYHLTYSFGELYYSLKYGLIKYSNNGKTYTLSY